MFASFEQVATGAAVFHEAGVGKGCEVRINGVVHLKSHLAAGETVPIGWVAVGFAAQILRPGSMTGSGSCKSR